LAEARLDDGTSHCFNQSDDLSVKFVLLELVLLDLAAGDAEGTAVLGHQHLELFEIVKTVGMRVGLHAPLAGLDSQVLVTLRVDPRLDAVLVLHAHNCCFRSLSTRRFKCINFWLLLSTSLQLVIERSFDDVSGEFFHFFVVRLIDAGKFLDLLILQNFFGDGLADLLGQSYREGSGGLCEEKAVLVDSPPLLVSWLPLIADRSDDFGIDWHLRPDQLLDAGFGPKLHLADRVSRANPQLILIVETRLKVEESKWYLYLLLSW
jgi:hypothetical protein